MEWKTTAADDDMPEEHYTTLKNGSSGIFGEKSKLPLIIILIGIVFLVALFFIVNPRPPKTVQPETDAIDTRLALLERQISEIDAIKEDIAEMNAGLRKDKVLAADIDRLTDAIQANAAAISQISAKIGQLEKEVKKAAEQIKVPTAAGPPPKPAPTASSAPPAATSPAAAKPGAGLIYHNVQKGDTLYRLSVKYGISVPKLQELNNMGDKTDLFPGTQVIVGPAKQ